FSSLKASDTLKVRYTSTGCFHFCDYEFTFRRDATTTVSVVSVLRKWSERDPDDADKSREKLGQIQLNAADLAGLDELLRFYRSKPSGFCTTRDNITISQVQDGKIIATERFQDNSCETRETNRITTLPELARRLEKKEGE